MSTNILKATHVGSLEIGETTLNVAVLNNGKRIINYSSIFNAFGRTKRGKQKDGSRVHNMPAFLNANNLQPYVGDDLRGALEIINYTNLLGNDTTGYTAEILPLLCKVYLDARQDKVLKSQQLPNARAAEILLVSLSKIGVVALVDEATGYQYDRERDELQIILSAYISKELLPWQHKFPDEFYKEIFRLNGWGYFASGNIDIKKRPSVIGHWTNDLIYKRLPKNVLEELKKNTPKSKRGNYTARFHQSLSMDIGQPHLERQLASVLTLMKISDNWKDFMLNFNKAYGQQNLFDTRTFKEPEIKKRKEKLSDFDEKLVKALEYDDKGKKEDK